MALKFFGRGSGFANDHNSAYFCPTEKEIVIIDLPVSTFQKLKSRNLDNYDELYVLITHTHGDHIGGLGLFVQYAFWTFRKTVTIIAPSNSVAKDISTLFVIEGIEPSWYDLIVPKQLDKPWIICALPTNHSYQLHRKCFGYLLKVNGEDVLYTGDTCTLEPFLSYLRKGFLLYVDTSVHDGMVHLKLDCALPELIKLTKQGVKVYLMHLDDIESAEEIIKDIPNISIVSVD